MSVWFPVFTNFIESASSIMIMLPTLLFALGVQSALASQVVLSGFGPNISPPAKGNVKYTLPTERTFLLNVPDSYNHEESHPLVLSFHGGWWFRF